MNEQAHTFHPQDESFKSRFEELHRTIQNLRIAKESLISNDERLGDEKEKREAVSIFENSLRVATNAFSSNEISKIKDDQLLAKPELTELIAAERLAKIEAHRSDSDGSEQTLKR
jgi:hypothetical protein